MFENIGLRFALMVVGTLNQGWLMKDNWKLKLVEVLPYLILALTLLISVTYENSTKKVSSYESHSLKRVATLKPVVNSETDR